MEVTAMAAQSASRSFTVYLIRHGEAVHNVEEKRARKNTMSACSARGLASDDAETVQLMEEARKEVLRDPTFFDAEITEKGKSEARMARKALLQCVAEGLPTPREVLTSPLQRCLGTVEECFPDHEVKIRVEEDLRERLTGRPADNRLSSESLEERFPRFDFGILRSLSSSNLVEELRMVGSDVSDSSSVPFGDDSFASISRQSSFESPPLARPIRRTSSLNVDEEREDDDAVRQRAFQIFRMLEQSQSDAVAVVTHKGFLRALERGCFGISASPEFGNCEMRAYRIQLTPGNLYLDKIERLR